MKTPIYSEASKPEALHTISENKDGKAGFKKVNRTAVLVFHGMGQQIPYQSITEISNALISKQKKINEEHKIPDYNIFTTQQYKLNEKIDARGVLDLRTIESGSLKQKEVHVYEAYWAPETEGKINFWQVIRFLGSSTLDALKNIFKELGRFRRWMFGDMRDFGREGLKAFLFIVPTGIILFSLVMLILNFFLILGFRLFDFFELTVTKGAGYLLESIMLNFGVLTALAVIVCLLIFLVINLIVKNSEPAPFILIFYKTVSTLLFASLCVIFLLYGINSLAQILMLALNLENWQWLSEVFAVLNQPRSWAAWIPSGIYKLIIGSWIIFLFYIILKYTREYVGDVAIYVSSHKVRKDGEVRNKIKAISLNTAKAAYETIDDTQVPAVFLYDSIVIIGHSLGSVIAYDTLNAIINDELVSNPQNKLQVLKRTKNFITYGSPLNKTAYLFRSMSSRDENYVRESLAATKQPMVLSYHNRPKNWYNIYSLLDYISGDLSFYDIPKTKNSKRIKNRIDIKSFIPLKAHSEYLKHDILVDILYNSVMD